MLSVSELSTLMGVTERHIKTQCKEKVINSFLTFNEKNRPKYLIPLEDLSPNLQAKYYKQRATSLPYPIIPQNVERVCRELDSFAADERSEIDCWINLIEQWQVYRNKDGVKSKAEVDDKFVTYMKLEKPDINISIDILYRKWAAIRDGDFGLLVDKRGKTRKGISETPEEIVQTFQSFYLQEAKHPIARCIEYTELYLREYPHI